MKAISCAALVLLALSVAGCSTLKKVTGQTDDTVLAGKREEVIPPDQMTAKDPMVMGQGQSQDLAQTQTQTQAPPPVDTQITAAPLPCKPKSKKQKCPAVKQVQ
ncbi:MAG: hypothetical protein KGO94_13995 [Alphaproteobacteria bacterium]|nr:hypothetical protein [Alphaproteobacteria bacterium]